MSVSNRTPRSASSGTLLPLVTRWNAESRIDAESLVQSLPEIRGRVPADVCIDGIADDGGERLAFARASRLQLSALFSGQVHLRAGRWRIQRSRQHESFVFSSGGIGRN